MTSIEANHPAIQHPDDVLAGRIDRTNQYIAGLRREVYGGGKLPPGVFPSAERRRIDREFDQRLACDDTEPGRDWME